MPTDEDRIVARVNELLSELRHGRHVPLTAETMGDTCACTIKALVEFVDAKIDHELTEHRLLDHGNPLYD